MNENLTEIICVLDRSGSMSSAKDDAIGGFNDFLTSQKELDGEASMTVALFDNEYEVLYDGVDIQEVDPLDDATFVPRGMTALYDAVGRTIDDVGVRLSKMKEDERPGKVIFVILTDGEENSSREYTGRRIHDMITHQTDTYSWEFLFLGANIDAQSVAGGLGISSKNALTYTNDSTGNQAAYDSVSRAVSSYRASGLVSDDWGNDKGLAAPLIDDSSDDTSEEDAQ